MPDWILEWTLAAVRLAAVVLVLVVGIGLTVGFTEARENEGRNADYIAIGGILATIITAAFILTL